jgi:hypothetical protein
MLNGPLRDAINASQSEIEPGTSCTAVEHSMQRAIRTAVLTAIRNLALYYYSSHPKAAMSQALDWDRG